MTYLTPNDIADLRIEADKLSRPLLRDLLDAYEDHAGGMDRIQALEEDVSAKEEQLEEAQRELNDERARVERFRKALYAITDADSTATVEQLKAIADGAL
jgi:predicted  nucleic acid-binding Zn-ribbon protein